MGRPYRTYAERVAEIRRELTLATAGIGDLVNVNLDAEEDDPPRCAECGGPLPCAFERTRE
jgi:hypothetical protein